MSQSVHRRSAFSETDLAEMWEMVGMPFQDWWLFRFVVPSALMNGADVVFGTSREPKFVETCDDMLAVL